jgi:hypothetical protein
MDILSPVEDLNTAVFGTAAGDSFNKTGLLIGILVGDDFFPGGGGQLGSFTEGFLFTENTVVKPGDVVKIVRKDNQSFSYKVQRTDDIGVTDLVFRKWKLSALETNPAGF